MQLPAYTYYASDNEENTTDHVTKPTRVSVTKRRKRYSSGYMWRNVELTRQDWLCLLLFGQGLDNHETAEMLHISVHTVKARSDSLRLRLHFYNRKEMVLAIKKVDFLSVFPEDLIDSLFAEIASKSKNKNLG